MMVLVKNGKTVVSIDRVNTGIVSLRESMAFSEPKAPQEPRLTEHSRVQHMEEALAMPGSQANRDVVAW